MKKTTIDFHPNKNKTFLCKAKVNVNIDIINGRSSATQKEESKRINNPKQTWSFQESKKK